MALLKEKTLANGSVGNYWKIISEVYDKRSMRCTWIIGLFTSQAHSLSGSPDLGCRKTFSHLATREELQGNRTQLGYTKIKEIAAAPGHAFGDTPVAHNDVDLIDTVDV